jgi:hypothetical protein
LDWDLQDKKMVHKVNRIMTFFMGIKISRSN